MSDQNPGFGKFVPGFDFLQNLAKGAGSLPQMPSLSSWVAPTLNVEELEKRIGELKAVHFWLDQNSRALAATIQALELQKMTLSTLKGMNFDMADLANAMKLKPVDGVMGGVQKVAETAAGAADAVSGVARAAAGKAAARTSRGKAAAPAGVVDPLQWWGALTQQFQQIAAGAMKDATRATAVDAARNMATGMAKEAMKTAGGALRAGAAARKGSSAPAKRAARKSPARKTGGRAPR